MDTPRDELRSHLVAVLEAARELPRDDRQYLADVFLDELDAGYRLVPRARPPDRAGPIEADYLDFVRASLRWWPVIAATVALLIVLPAMLLLAGFGVVHPHHPPFFLLWFLFPLGMRIFGPWRRGDRRRIAPR